MLHLLRRERELRGWSQAEVARRVGAPSAVAVGRWERGVVVPSPYYRERLCRLFERTAPELGFVPARPAAPAWGPPTRLVGREAELSRARSLLVDGGARLLTLTGAPGVGKTRLAQALVEGVGGEFADGVRVVVLGGVSEAEEVGAAVRRALGLPECAEAETWEAVAGHLEGRRALLVLDGFEHVLGAAGRLAELLERCPGPALLVTSRASLRVRVERVLEVEPLGVEASVELFVERARSAVPGLEPGPGWDEAVAAICGRLDGLPLALELAAPWLRVLSPESLLRHLERRLDLLVDGPVDLPERQRTLRAALAWSCDQATPAQRALLARLSVFVSPAPVEGVEHVAAALGASIAGVAPDLAALEQHSLVRRAEPGERAAVLDTVREYARELLAEAGEADAAARAHLDYYAGLAACARAAMRGPTEDAWLRRLRLEHDNLRAALAWADERRHAEAGLRLAAGLRLLWGSGGLRREGLGWLERLLAIEAPVDPGVRAAAHGAAGLLAGHLGLHDRAIGHQRESLAVCRAVSDARGVADALRLMGQLLAREGREAEAVAALREAVVLLRDLDDRPLLATALANLGAALGQRRDRPAARAAYEEALDINRAIGNEQGVTLCLVNLSDGARMSGDLALARARAEEAVAIARRSDSPYYLGLALINLGDLARTRDDPAAARDPYRESLLLVADIGGRLEATHGLRGLAWVAAREGRPLLATRLYAAAAALAPGIDPTDPDDELSHERARAAVREQMGAGAFDAAWAAGTVLALEDAVAEAVT